MKYGVDISTYNKSIDYSILAKNMGFAIARVGYGVQYLPEKQKDVMFEKHYEGLKNNNIPTGAYYYQYANEIGEGRKEAENCLKYLNGRKLDMPIYYDVEDGSVSGLNKEILTAIIKEFCETIESAGYKAGVYASKSWLNNKINTEELKQYSIWCAVYGKNDGNVPGDSYKYVGTHDIWQYTSRGYVEGINGRVDLNILHNDNIVGDILPEIKPEQTQKTFSGDETILYIQKTINEKYGLSIKEDGYYGKETKWALVYALQTELNKQFNKGLDVDGKFGAKTKLACINVRQGAKGNITWIIQAMLYCKGFDTNGIEGIFGKGTTSAVRKFQNAVGLTEDAIVGKNTFEKLFK